MISFVSWTRSSSALNHVLHLFVGVAIICDVTVIYLQKKQKVHIKQIFMLNIIDNDEIKYPNI